MTQMSQTASRDFDAYVRVAEAESLAALSASSSLWDTSDRALLAKGHMVERDLNRIGKEPRNPASAVGEIHDWVGAVMVPSAGVGILRALLAGYSDYARIYGPYVLLATPGPCTSLVRSLQECSTLFLRDRVLGTSYNFHVHFRNETSPRLPGANDNYWRLSRSTHIEELDGDGPNARIFPNSLDHGMLWRLNTYWRAWHTPNGVYVQYETISLTRSLDDFHCFGSMLDGVAKHVIARQMRTIPEETLKNTLSNTRTEIERRIKLEPYVCGACNVVPVGR